MRDLRIFCTSNGPSPGYVTHLYTYRVEDAEGNFIYTNADENPEEIEGPSDIGFHACLLDWLPQWRPAIVERLSDKWLTWASAAEVMAERDAPRKLAIVHDDLEGVFKPYNTPIDELRATGFRLESGASVRSSAWVAQVLSDAQNLKVTVSCRLPGSEEESATLALIKAEGERRGNAAAAAGST